MLEDGRKKIWSWYNIAKEFDVHETTVKRWCRTEPAFRAIIKRWRRRVFAYEDDLIRWKRLMVSNIDDPPRIGK